MKMPKGYNETQAFSDWTPLAPGGYVCKIVKAEETESKNGNPMLKIALDIAEGAQANRFHEQFWGDTRADKKWPCVMYQIVTNKDGMTAKGFKALMVSVEESNEGFKVVWDDKFTDRLKDKVLGVIFGREQYKNRDGELKWSTKPLFCRSAETIRKGDFAVPDDKYLTGVPAGSDSPAEYVDGFKPLTEADIDMDVPF